jgi:hypothetical protein
MLWCCKPDVAALLKRSCVHLRLRTVAHDVKLPEDKHCRRHCVGRLIFLLSFGRVGGFFDGGMGMEEHVIMLKPYWAVQPLRNPQ